MSVAILGLAGSLRLKSYNRALLRRYLVRLEAWTERLRGMA